MAYEPPAAAFRVAPPARARAPRQPILRRSRTALALAGLAALALAGLMQANEAQAVRPIAAEPAAR